MWRVLVKWFDADPLIVRADRWTITDGTLYFWLEDTSVAIFAVGEWIAATNNSE